MTGTEPVTADEVTLPPPPAKNPTTKLEDCSRGDSPCKESATQDGSDSGVEMNTKCRYHRRSTCEADQETDGGYSTVSSCTQSPYLTTETPPPPELTRQLTPGDGESNGESSLISYDGASENGSESSSVDDAAKKCHHQRPNCINLQKVYSAKGCRQTPPTGRQRLTSFTDSPAAVMTSSFRASCGRQSATPGTKCAAPNCDSPSPTDRRTLRSCSGTRTSTSRMSSGAGSCDEASKWSSPSSSLSSSAKKPSLPYTSLSDPRSTNIFETYATLPRRKQKENVERSPREPSLNRAASLRKKFLENSLMTTSLNSSMSPTSSCSPGTKTMPPYVKYRGKTKIYQEVSTQTMLTNGDVDKALGDRPFKIFNERVPPQNDTCIKDKQRNEEQLAELKKLRKENSKQRTVIEWLEGELVAAKDEKLKIQNRFVAVEQRISNLLTYKGSGTGDDMIAQLEREVACSNSMISKQQKEIAELQQLCCYMQKDLDSIHLAQKANEVESLELQEFLQAEKSTLTDSLKDLETELNACKKRLKEQEEELTNKINECTSLNAVSERLRQENQTFRTRLATLERRCKELLVHQGAVTSSASVALSGVGSRFEQLLDQLTSNYNITDNDLKDEVYQNIEPVMNGYKKLNDDNDNNEEDDTNRNFATPLWLKAVGNVMAAKQNCTDADSSKTNPLVECSGCTKNANEKSSSSIANEDSLSLSKVTEDSAIADEEDSRRNSILSDVYTTDDNLTLDFGISEALTDISESVMMRKNLTLERFNAESFNHDVSLVEQVLEVDNLVSKVFKAILYIETNKTNR